MPRKPTPTSPRNGGCSQRHISVDRNAPPADLSPLLRLLRRLTATRGKQATRGQVEAAADRQGDEP